MTSAAEALDVGCLHNRSIRNTAIISLIPGLFVFVVVVFSCLAFLVVCFVDVFV